MSHGSGSVTLKDVPAIVTAEAPRIPKLGKIGLVVLVVFGIVGFIAGLRIDPQRAWLAFQVNFIYWFILSAASTCFAAVFQICNAQWVRPLRRIFESPSNFFLYSIIPLAVVYLFGYESVFEHHEGIEGAKGVWLSRNFMYLRDIFAMGLVIFLGRKVVFLSMRQDIGAIRSGLTGLKKEDTARWFAREYDKFVQGWGSDALAEIQSVQDKRGLLSPVVVMAYALGLSMVAFDQVMSVDPHWVSTLFGAFIFMSGVYLAVAWNSMGVGLVRELSPLIRAKVQRSTLHDLGKLLFGFGIFWAYLFWSHYLTIWYGNLPEETGWLITRARLEPWHSVSWGVLWCLFFYPFLFGLNKDGKQNPRLLFITGTVVALGVWLLLFVLIVPTLYPTTVPLGATEAAVSLGFLAAFLLSAGAYLERVPLIPFGDLYVRKADH